MGFKRSTFRFLNKKVFKPEFLNLFGLYPYKFVTRARARAKLYNFGRCVV